LPDNGEVSLYQSNDLCYNPRLISYGIYFNFGCD
jgi:hypothetical protein